ncbi:hypothetical protein K438DRAFT_255593 [Mycena galopus ATCC 62051]|nr:hypothetical protein K438DRAFT_255593 [Mycena galopus ATCC 62051]
MRTDLEAKPLNSPLSSAWDGHMDQRSGFPPKKLASAQENGQVHAYVYFTLARSGPTGYRTVLSLYALFPSRSPRSSRIACKLAGSLASLQESFKLLQDSTSVRPGCVAPSELEMNGGLQWKSTRKQTEIKRPWKISWGFPTYSIRGPGHYLYRLANKPIEALRRYHAVFNWWPGSRVTPTTQASACLVLGFAPPSPMRKPLFSPFVMTASNPEHRGPVLWPRWLVVNTFLPPVHLSACPKK